MNFDEIVERFSNFGLEVLVEDREILIPAYVTHANPRYGDLQLRQGNYEITYINSTKRLCVYNEKNECLEVYLPKGASVHFYRGYLILTLLG
jgi:hypothetical protein